MKPPLAGDSTWNIELQKDAENSNIRSDHPYYLNEVADTQRIWTLLSKFSWRSCLAPITLISLSSEHSSANIFSWICNKHWWAHWTSQVAYEQVWSTYDEFLTSYKDNVDLWGLVKWSVTENGQKVIKSFKCIEPYYNHFKFWHH